MTDTRLPEHFLTDAALDGLSDPAYRCHINGLMWSVTHGTDGAIPVRALRWLHPDATRTAAAVDELVAAGLWAEDDAGGWSIRDFLMHQTAAEDVRAGRASERDSRRRRRKHAREDHSECRPDTCTVVRMSGADTGVRPGRTPEDRTGLTTGRGTRARASAATGPTPTPPPLAGVLAGMPEADADRNARGAAAVRDALKTKRGRSA